MLNLLFSLTGRIGRAEFWAGYVVCAVFIVGGLFGLGEFAKTQTEHHATSLIAFMFYGFALAALWMSGCVTVKRLHDLGRSGFLFWVVLIPVGPIYLIHLCGFQPGIGGIGFDRGLDPTQHPGPTDKTLATPRSTPRSSRTQTQGFGRRTA